MNHAILLIARLLLAHMFLISGVQKITGYDGTLQYMSAFGLPGWLLPLVIIVEVGGGALLVLGLWTRWAAWALAGFTLAAALVFHTNFAEQMQVINFMKNLTIAGGMLMLAVHGPGGFSLEARKRP